VNSVGENVELESRRGGGDENCRGHGFLVGGFASRTRGQRGTNDSTEGWRNAASAQEVQEFVLREPAGSFEGRREKVSDGGEHMKTLGGRRGWTDVLIEKKGRT